MIDEDDVIVYAEDGEDFQEYMFEDRTRVPTGTPVGINTTINGKTEFLMLRNIYYSDEARNI